MVLDESVLRRSNALRDMLRLARSIVADGHVTETEAKLFQAWIDRNPDMTGIYPISEFVGILRSAFADGHLSEEERAELKALLENVAGTG